jgi:outer membrane receptor for ferrienterochelin and colicins
VRGNLITHADHHILVLVNGRPFRDARETNSNFALYSALPLGLVDRIEVIRGPGSVLYGSNAVSGVINIITRKPVGRAARLTAGGGSFGTASAVAEADLKGQDWTVLAAGSYYSEDGWPLAAATNFPVPALGIRRSEADYGELNRTATALVEYKRFAAQLMHLDVRYDTMGALPHWSSAGEVRAKRSFADLSYVQPLRASWDLKLSLTLNDLRQNIRDRTAPGLTDVQENALATVFEVAARGKIGEGTKVIVGALTESRANYDRAVAGPNGSPAVPVDYAERHYGAYLQADRQVFSRFKLVGGVQYNRTDSGHSALVPRVGAIVPLGGSVTLKGLWGEAFRTATPLEEYINVPNTLIGRADLRPEKVSTFDVQVFLDRPRSQTTLTYFHAKYTDVVERIPAPGAAPAFTFRNAGVNTIQGLELEHKGRLVKGLYLTGSLTLQDEKEDKLFVPEYMAKGGISYSVGRVGAGLFHTHFGKPRENAPLAGLQLNAPAHGIDLLSLNLTYRFKAGVPMTAMVYGSNLLDDDMHYTEFARGWTNTLPIGPGRAIYARLRAEF